jgi:hypothetical protein
MSAPSVYAAINAITAEFATHGIAKTHVNHVDDYKYRSIDDLLDRLAPLLGRHKLCVLPRVKQRLVTDRADEQGRLLLQVALRVSFKLTSVDDGSSYKVEAYGEALDSGDKATAKAMSAAYKSAMIQTFCIPCGTEDADRTSYKLAGKIHSAEPLQGWTQWCLDVEDIVALCESEVAIKSIQERHRDLLKALSRERPDLYRQLGDAFSTRRELLTDRAASTNEAKAPQSAKSEAPSVRNRKGERHTKTEIENA